MEQYFEPEELAEAVKVFDVLVVRSKTRVDAHIIDAAKAGGTMKMIIRGDIGSDNVDVRYAKENGIEVCDISFACHDSVADSSLYMYPKVPCTPDIRPSAREAQKRTSEEIVKVIESLQLRERNRFTRK